MTDPFEGRRAQSLVFSGVHAESGTVVLTVRADDGKLHAWPFAAGAASAAATALITEAGKLGADTEVSQALKAVGVQVAANADGRLALAVLIEGGAELFLEIDPGQAGKLARDLANLATAVKAAPQGHQ